MLPHLYEQQTKAKRVEVPDHDGLYGYAYGVLTVCVYQVWCAGCEGGRVGEFNHGVQCIDHIWA